MQIEFPSDFSTTILASERGHVELAQMVDHEMVTVFFSSCRAREIAKALLDAANEVDRLSLLGGETALEGA